HLPRDPLKLEIDGGRGKRSRFINLKQAAGRETLESLVRNADVFVQGYRPGTMDSNGFSPERLAELRPGIVSVSISAWGHEGPFAHRRGFDSIVQTASGINWSEAQAAGVDGPKPLPCQALDFASGYLMAMGAMAALHKRATEGGSWRVRIALARTGRWLQSLGRIDNGFGHDAPSHQQLTDLMTTIPSAYGDLSVIRHPIRLSETPVPDDLAPEPYPGRMPPTKGVDQ
ncbi:MAG: CoA transferase, partial [Alphaproteobacteria bacterium]|nr:CoA transferase [Alphaproteobacteria bacterium]